MRVMWDWKRTYCMAHRLVWRHFCGSIPEGLTINHRNGMKKDNRPGNLELATYSQQMIHAMDVLGKNLHMRQQHGENNHRALLTEDAVRHIRILRDQILAEMHHRHGKMIAELAEAYGVDYQTVWSVLRKRSWQGSG